MKKYLFFIGTAFMLLVLRPTPGWSAEDFEIVWEHDLTPDDYNFFYYHNSYFNYPIYALSSDADNFFIYQDYYNSFKVFDLTSGIFIKRIIVDTNLSKFDPKINQFPSDSIASMQLIENKTKLAVWGSNGYFYIFDTKNWNLIRKVEAKGVLSNDGKILYVTTSGSGGKIYDFNTMKQTNYFALEDPAGYSAGWAQILISNDGKRAAFSRLLDGWGQIPDGWICNVYDLEKQTQLFRYVAEKSSDMFINSDLSKLYLNKNSAVSEYDMNTGKLAANWGICNNSSFRYKMSENEKYIFCSVYSDLLTARLNINVQTHEWYSGNDNVGFLDAGKDYILALRNITDMSASMIKLKINIEEITPVDDKSNNIEILFPNPTSSIVHISGIKISNLKDVKVFDNIGTDYSKKCIITILPDAVDLNLQRLSKGMYFIQINTSTISKTYKVIKN